MARRRTASKKFDEPGFALIPGEVLDSDACRALPDYAFRCLAALTAFNRTSNDPEQRRNHPGNNGDLSLPVSVAARVFGIRPNWRLSAGLQLCRHVRLIEITRIGRVQGGKGVAQLYGLCWLPIAPSEKYDRPRVMPRPADTAWQFWKLPADWKKIELRIRQTAQGKKISDSTRVYRKAPFRSTRVERDRSTRVYRKAHESTENGYTAVQPVCTPSMTLHGGNGSASPTPASDSPPDLSPNPPLSAGAKKTAADARRLEPPIAERMHKAKLRDATQCLEADPEADVCSMHGITTAERDEILRELETRPGEQS